MSNEEIGSNSYSSDMSESTLNRLNRLKARMGMATQEPDVVGIDEEDGTLTSFKSCWVKVAPDIYTLSGENVQVLPPGSYIIKVNKGQVLFEKRAIYTDSLIKFSNSLHTKILKEIDDFWGLSGEFDKYGFLHRRGILLYGNPGGGKSCLINLIVENIIEKGGIVLVCDEVDFASEALHQLRGVEPTKPIVCLFEDMDGIIERENESTLLNLLDGTSKINHILNIGTTNYIDKLEDRYAYRPRRFDRVIEVGMPDDLTRREYFINKFKIEKEEDLDKWVASSKGMSFAAMTEMIISVKCFRYTMEETVERLSKRKKFTGEKGSKLGFLQEEGEVGSHG